MSQDFKRFARRSATATPRFTWSGPWRPTVYPAIPTSTSSSTGRIRPGSLATAAGSLVRPGQGPASAHPAGIPGGQPIRLPGLQPLSDQDHQSPRPEASPALGSGRRQARESGGPPGDAQRGTQRPHRPAVAQIQPASLREIEPQLVARYREYLVRFYGLVDREHHEAVNVHLLTRPRSYRTGRRALSFAQFRQRPRPAFSERPAEAGGPGLPEWVCDWFWTGSGSGRDVDQAPQACFLASARYNGCPLAETVPKPAGSHLHI